MAWILAVAVALVAWAALLLQFWILANALGCALAGWRFVGFFTILSNIGVASIATAIAVGKRHPLAGSRARLMGLTSIMIVGLVYSLLLRSTWNPVGLQKVADMALHDVTPLLFALLWALMPHGELAWSDFKWALAPPALYLAYALARGAIDGWYAYWFLNPSTQALAELAAAVVGVLGLFAIVAAGAIAIDRWWGGRARPAKVG